MNIQPIGVITQVNCRKSNKQNVTFGIYSKMIDEGSLKCLFNNILENFMKKNPNAYPRKILEAWSTERLSKLLKNLKFLEDQYKDSKLVDVYTYIGEKTINGVVGSNSAVPANLRAKGETVSDWISPVDNERMFPDGNQLINKVLEYELAMNTTVNKQTQMQVLKDEIKKTA